MIDRIHTEDAVRVVWSHDVCACVQHCSTDSQNTSIMKPLKCEIAYTQTH